MSPPSDARLNEALSRFDELLRHDSPEVEFQRLFAAYPHILSRTLPLRVAASEIVPLGRPGMSEPDFITVPSTLTPLSSYGVIELKRPSSPILTRPRKGILTLSRTAQTAVAQGEAYGRDLFRHTDILDPADVLALGNQTCVFIVMGLSSELTAKLGAEMYASQVDGLLPQNCRLIPYDTLFRAFESTVPPRLVVLVPTDIPAGLALRHRERDGRHTFAFFGDLDMATSSQAYAAIDAYLTPQSQGILLDLEGIDFIDSSGMRFPISIKTKCEEESCEFFLFVGKSRQVERLLRVTGAAAMLSLVQSRPSGY